MSGQGSELSVESGLVRPVNVVTPRKPMPPQADPYATPANRRIDALLLIVSAITVAILLLSGSHGHAINSVTPHPTAEESTR